MSETGKHERFCRVRLIVQGYISFESSLFEISLKVDATQPPVAESSVHSQLETVHSKQSLPKVLFVS